MILALCVLSRFYFIRLARVVRGDTCTSCREIFLRRCHGLRHRVAAIFFYNRAAFARRTIFLYVISSSLHFAGHLIELATQGVSPVPAGETGFGPVSVCFSTFF